MGGRHRFCLVCAMCTGYGGDVLLFFFLRTPQVKSKNPISFFLVLAPQTSIPTLLLFDFIKTICSLLFIPFGFPFFYLPKLLCLGRGSSPPGSVPLPPSFSFVIKSPFFLALLLISLDLPLARVLSLH